MNWAERQPRDMMLGCLMDLPEVVNGVLPAVVALGSRIVPSQNPQVPLFPLIFGTGFLIDPRVSSSQIIMWRNY